MGKKKSGVVIAVGGLLFASLFSFSKLQLLGQSISGPFLSDTKNNELNKKLTATKFDSKSAIEKNAQLKDNLKWTFGSKNQIGWNIYVPLIQKLIGANDQPQTEKFAIALSKWQQTSNLEANGILDSETLNQMIQFWQSQRLNSSVYPEPDDLFTAPIADFYDSTRSVELLKVKRDAYDAYKKMVAAAIADKSLNLKTDRSGNLAADEKMLKIISAFRSREYQEKLRQKSPNSGRAGLALNSPHFTGCALDIYVGGEPVTTKDENRAIQIETPVYKWLVKNAEKFGFYPYYYEPWHWEYAPKNLK
jgi:zinc D-Ala-D-Ala carboxypeptidase